MKVSCNIIRDMLPLYCDNICSKESREMIEEHLSGCGECNEILSLMRSDSLEIKDNNSAELEKLRVLKNIKKSILRKKVFTGIAAAACTIAVIFGMYSAAVLIENPIEYKEGLVRVELAYDGVIDSFYQGSNYACAYGMEKQVISNGQTQKAVFIYYTDSFWTKYLERKHASGTLQFSIGENIMADYGGNGEEVKIDGPIDAVYYLVGDYSKLITMNQEEFAKYAEKAVLLWQR